MTPSGDTGRLPRVVRRSVPDLVAAIVFLGFVALPGCSAGPAPAPLADPAAEDDIAAARERVRNEALVKATESMAASAVRDAATHDFGPLHQLTGLDPDEQRALAEALACRLRKATRELTAASDRGRGIRDPLVSAWHRCAGVRVAQARIADAAERDARKARQTALALGTENRWFWLAGLMAVATLAAVFALDRRHDIRRTFYGGTARDLGLGRILIVALAAMAAVTAALFFASDGLLVDLLTPRGAGAARVAVDERRAEDAAEAARKGAALEARRTDIERERAAARTRLAAIVPADDAAGRLFDDWWAYWQAATENRALLAEIAAVADRLERDRISADPSREESVAHAIAHHRETAAFWRSRARFITGCIGTGLLALVAGGCAWYLRGVSGRVRERARTCPRCLSRDHLQSDERMPNMLRCHHQTSATGKPCDFTFPVAHRRLRKISFVTLGERSSGKTLWTAMTYKGLVGGDYPEGSFSCQRVTTEAASEYDANVDRILNHEDVPGTGPQRLPHPLALKLSHVDRLGTADFVLNVFDLAGEVYAKMGAMAAPGEQQERALSANGFLLFIDPDRRARTVADGKPIPGTFDPSPRQERHLSAFGEKVADRAIRNACPVAVCVPKIDLLTVQRYADGNGGDAIAKFYESLREIGWDMDLKSIAARSALMLELRDVIWPGWSLEKEISRIFGGRCMFFPLTAVGLDGVGRDWIDEKRPISPVGILHPLMWLLHMNGYPVLPRTAAG